MAIPTSRTKEPGRVNIDLSKCNGCGLCAEVCKNFSLEIRDNHAVVCGPGKFGCIACGHCMAICPTGSITVDGRYLSSSDLFTLPLPESGATYESLLALYQRRRSIREFREQAVPPELIQKVLDAARTAPMGLPPSVVHVLALTSREQVRRFSSEFWSFLEGMKWMVSGWFLALMKPVVGKSTHELFRDFMRPLIYAYTAEMKKGNDIVTYDAPVALYFYGSPFCDPADPIIAATYAMTAAETLGLGTCMLGAIHPMIQNGGPARKFRDKWGIRFKSREGVFVILGYPRVKYHSGINRTFAEIAFVN